MDHDAVIHIVDIVALHAVEDLDILLGAGHLGLARGLHGIGEGLGDTVIGDADGPVSPARSCLDRRAGWRQSIHVGHGGMQVQLHPLEALGGVLALGHGAWGYAVGPQDGLVVELVHVHLALDPEHGAHGNIVQDRLGLVGLHELADTDGVGVVGHVEIDDPGVALFQLLVVHGEDPALHDDEAHVEAQVLHGHGIPLEGLAVEGIALLLRGGAANRGRGLLVRELGLGALGHHLHAHLLHGIKEGLSLQLATRLDGDLHILAAELLQGSPHGGDGVLQHFPTVGPELDGQAQALPLPDGTRQGAHAHGILPDEEGGEIRGLHLVQASGGKGPPDVQSLQTVGLLHLPADLSHAASGDGGRCIELQLDDALHRVQLCPPDDGILQQLPKLLLRLIEGKHIQKEYIVLHNQLPLVDLQSRAGACSRRNFVHRAKLPCR